MTDESSKKTILVVDDMDYIRDLVKQALEEQYAVFDAADGQLAIELAEKLIGMGKNIDLLITDLLMPGMTGRRLAGELKARLPGIKVIYMSGYHKDAVVDRQVANGEVAFLQKPLELPTLLHKVREMLDSPAR